ncbi:MAG: transposase [Deinococcales bacterium]
MSTLTVRCTLQPTVEQVEILSKTVDAFTHACNDILAVAKEHDTFNKYQLQKLCYQEIRVKHGLSANLAIRALARVGKRKGKRTAKFQASSVDYDQRTLSLDMKSSIEQVSLSTLEGRQRINLKLGNYQRHFAQQSPKRARWSSCAWC